MEFEPRLCKTKIFKKMYEALLEFSRGVGILEKSLPQGRYGYFIKLHNVAGVYLINMT